MIPQDLIAFVKWKRPAVLPGHILYRDSDMERFRFGSKDAWPLYHAWIDDDHAAALLEHWLMDELTPENLEIIGPINNSVKPGWEVYLNFGMSGEVSAYADDKLSALWEAYKKVKGIKE